MEVTRTAVARAADMPNSNLTTLLTGRSYLGPQRAARLMSALDKLAEELAEEIAKTGHSHSGRDRRKARNRAAAEKIRAAQVAAETETEAPARPKPVPMIHSLR